MKALSSIRWLLGGQTELPLPSITAFFQDMQLRVRLYWTASTFLSQPLIVHHTFPPPDCPSVRPSVRLHHRLFPSPSAPGFIIIRSQDTFQTQSFIVGFLSCVLSFSFDKLLIYVEAFIIDAACTPIHHFLGNSLKVGPRVLVA